MELKEIMSTEVLRIHPEATVAFAARQLAGNNIGALPVCGNDGRLVGMVTDRDLVIRCLAAERSGEGTRVREVMTGSVVWAPPDMEISAAAALMGRKQVRRLPVVESGRLCGMVSLGDLASRGDAPWEAAQALENISGNIL